MAPARIGLAGYSFGSRVSLQTAGADPRVQAVAMIALPTSRLDTTTALDDYQKPKFFISGGRDDVSNTDALRAYVDHLPEPRTLQVVEGIDHFWLGAESAMADAVADFLCGTPCEARPTVTAGRIGPRLAPAVAGRHAAAAGGHARS